MLSYKNYPEYSFGGEPRNFGGKNFAPQEREMTNIGFLTLKPKALLNHKNLALLIKKYVCGPIGAADENF